MKKLFFFLFILFSCGDNTMSPTEIPNPGLNDIIPEEPPTIYPKLHTQFRWSLSRGFTLFAGARASESDIRSLFDEYRRAWPGLRLTARVCGEVQSWPNDRVYLPRGVSAKPFDSSAPAYIQLKNFLDVAASIPDAQVLVVPVCNLKEDGTSHADVTKWVKVTCKLASRYDNTAVEVINEAHHPNSSYRDSVSSVNRLIRDCQGASERIMEIGSDTNINKRRTDYAYSGATFFSYHPWRNPDPTKEQLRAIVRNCIGCTVFSETTSLDVEGYSPSYGGKTEDIEQIMEYAKAAEKSGGVFVYHTTWGLGWPELPIGYIIGRGDWEIRHGR